MSLTQQINLILDSFLFVKFNKNTVITNFLGGTDGQLFQNPTFQWTMNPPAAWTYPETYALLTQQFFPGQPLTQADANNQADGDITAAVRLLYSFNNKNE